MRFSGVHFCHVNNIQVQELSKPVRRSHKFTSIPDVRMVRAVWSLVTPVTRSSPLISWLYCLLPMWSSLVRWQDTLRLWEKYRRIVYLVEMLRLFCLSFITTVYYSTYRIQDKWNIKHTKVTKVYVSMSVSMFLIILTIKVSTYSWVGPAWTPRTCAQREGGGCI